MSCGRDWLVGTSLAVVLVLAVGSIALAGGTLSSIRTVPSDFESVVGSVDRSQISDRSGIRLNETFINLWNSTDIVGVHEVPDLLVDAFVYAEDRRFFAHGGQDWLARVAALSENIMTWTRVRGASTISEQVVRMIHERPRTYWSRWVEGWEAVRLERQFTKWEILEFYLNQVPFASNRRGVVQAARMFFDRDLTSLSDSEILALAVMIRAPSVLRPGQNETRLQESVIRLRDQLAKYSHNEQSDIKVQDLDLNRSELYVDASHFVRYVQRNTKSAVSTIRTTLDAHLQSKLQQVLNSRIEDLSNRGVSSGAILVVDATNGEILTWASSPLDPTVDHSSYDAVLIKRQPGSTLKPFLYSLALDKGWTAATQITDTPLAERNVDGIHHYRNYSNIHYGDVTLRNALGNSLNIPAVKTLRDVGEDEFLRALRKVGLYSLAKDSEFYGGGLALGNGEVSLYELVRAYLTFANRGLFRELTALSGAAKGTTERRVFSREIASLVSNILSDPTAREWEFGNGILNFPFQTAIKTGTSNSFRDSWAVAYNNDYVVGAWMGNLNSRSMDGVTGAIGPAVVVRTAFDILNRQANPTQLWLSPLLKSYSICSDTGLVALPNDSCKSRTEFFIRGTEPSMQQSSPLKLSGSLVRISDPTANLEIALDPRVPRELQAYEFVLDGVTSTDSVVWNINGKNFQSNGATYLWQLSAGSHVVQASVIRDDSIPTSTQSVSFSVH